MVYKYFKYDELKEDCYLAGTTYTYKIAVKKGSGIEKMSLDKDNAVVMRGDNGDKSNTLEAEATIKIRKYSEGGFWFFRSKDVKKTRIGSGSGCSSTKKYVIYLISLI